MIYTVYCILYVGSAENHNRIAEDETNFSSQQYRERYLMTQLIRLCGLITHSLYLSVLITKSNRQEFKFFITLEEVWMELNSSLLLWQPLANFHQIM